MNGFVLGILVICAASSVRCARPVISVKRSEFLPYPGTDLVVAEGNTFTLRCKAATPVSWTSYPPPRGLIDLQHTSVVRAAYKVSERSLSHEVPLLLPASRYTFPQPSLGARSDSVNVSAWYDPADRTYVSTIRVETDTGADFLKTGYYYCSTDAAKNLEDEANVARVYVYVRGDSHRFVGFMMSYPIVYQNDTILIPCRPMAPDFQVSLLIDGKKMDLGHRKNDNGLNLAFDPKFGFTFKNVNFDNATYFECHSLFECEDPPCAGGSEYFDLSDALYSNKSVEAGRQGPTPWFLSY